MPAVRADVLRHASQIESTVRATILGVAFDRQAAKPPAPLTPAEPVRLAHRPQPEDARLTRVASQPARQAPYPPSWSEVSTHRYTSPSHRSSGRQKTPRASRMYNMPVVQQQCCTTKRRTTVHWASLFRRRCGLYSSASFFSSRSSCWDVRRSKSRAAMRLIFNLRRRAICRASALRSPSVPG